MKQIFLNRDEIALVDDEDYERVVEYEWRAHHDNRMGIWYARRSTDNLEMHRFLIEPPGNRYVDHINHNGLDNQKANLRIVTKFQYQANRRKNRTNSSPRYKRVSW